MSLLQCALYCALSMYLFYDYEIDDVPSTVCLIEVFNLTCFISL